MKSRFDAFLFGIVIIGALIGLGLYVRPDLAAGVEADRLIYLALILAFLASGGIWGFARGFAIGAVLLWGAFIAAVALAYQALHP